MNTPSIPTTTATNEPDGTFDQRLAAVHDDLRQDALSGAPEPAAEGVTAPADEQGSPQPPAPSAADSDDAAKRAQERRARLEALKAAEREKVGRNEQKIAAQKLAADLEQARREAAEAKALADKRIDFDSLDERSLLGLAQRKGIRPDKLAEWIADSMTNPERVAEHTATIAAKGIVDPVVAALTAKLTHLEQRLATYDQQAEQQRQLAEAQKAAGHFVDFVKTSAPNAPLASKLLETDPDEFWQLADIAATRVPNMGPEALLDALEDMLDSDTRAVAQKYAALYGFAPSNVPAATTPPRSAAAKATTVSNAHAQQRASVVEEDDFADLSFDERVARIKASG